MSVRIIAHRGAPFILHPENTLASFRRAVNLGADMIELDIRTTKDDVPIVMHDITIDRVTEGSGLINHFTLNNVRKLKVGKELIPTLEEVIEEFKDRVHFNLEVKELSAVDPVIKLIQKYDLTDTVLISTFEKEIIKKFENWNEHLQTGLLCWVATKNNIKFAKKHHVDFIHAYHLWLTKRKSDYIHKEGLKINVWTVDSFWEIDRIFKYDVAGIITNRPFYVRKRVENEQ